MMRWIHGLPYAPLKQNGRPTCEERKTQLQFLLSLGTVRRFPHLPKYGHARVCVWGGGGGEGMGGGFDLARF